MAQYRDVPNDPFTACRLQSRLGRLMIKKMGAWSAEKKVICTQRLNEIMPSCEESSLILFRSMATSGDVHNGSVKPCLVKRLGETVPYL